MKDDPNVSCGYWILNTGQKEKLIEACGWHDLAYERDSWQQKNMTRAEVDAWFYKQALLLAGDDKLKQLKARLFHVIVRGVGWLFWEAPPEPDPVDSSKEII